MKKILLVLLLIFSSEAFAAEEILKYESLIHLRNDASAIVTETITVRAQGDKIRRGIYRDLPKEKGVSYHAIAVRRDGQPETFFIQNPGRYYRINTGDDRLLPHSGVYVYEIVYQAFNVVQSFPEYDEIYWNVTGNGWDFPILSAEARVILPSGAKKIQNAGYIGRKGSKESALFENGRFISPRPLKTGEGLSIASGFGKGFINFPEKPENFMPEEWDVFLLSAFILGAYMALTWLKYGRDPEKEAVMPRFDVPKKLTAAQAGYVYMYGKNKEECLAAAFLQGSINGLFKIKENNGFTVTLLRSAENSEEKLFEHNLNFPLRLTDRYNENMKKFMNLFEKSLKIAAEGKYFVSNRILTGIGIALMLLLTTGIAYVCGVTGMMIILLFYLLFFISAINGIISMFLNKKVNFSLLFFILFVFVHFGLFTAAQMARQECLAPVLFYCLGGIALAVYSHLIKRPSIEGQKIIAHIDGLKMFLKALKTDIPSEVSFNRMEKLLPFAYLLGLEKEWEETMNRLMKSFTRQERPDRTYFRPRMFKSFSKSIRMSCTPPSKSGSGGRGFSGGGRGGGGGGGR